MTKFRKWYENLQDYDRECYEYEQNNPESKKNGVIIPVAEYNEKYPVFLTKDGHIFALNEGGYNSVELDAEMLYEYLHSIYGKDKERD